MNSQDLRNLQEVYLEVAMGEGKVPWDDPAHPLQSGHTPAEKNRAKRARTGVEDPNKSQMDISDRSMSRYGGMKTADDTETSKAPKQKKTLFGKPKPLEHETPPHEFKKNRKLDLKQTGNEYSMNKQSFGKGNATIGQARRAVGANFAGYRDGDSSIFPTPIKQGDTRRRTSKKWGGPNPRTRKENVDLYNVIFSHLLDEAEGSYGQTPKATAAYIALATRKGRKGSTKSKALAHAIRSSTRQPITTPSHRSNMTPSDRTYYRGQDENRGGDREPIDFGRDSEGINFDDNDTGPSGPGGMPKGKKLKRQRIRGISASYEPDLYDVILEYLLDEGYADTQESALAIMGNMSEDWRESIAENVTSGKGRVRNIQPKPPTGPISNSEKQSRIDADNIRIKKAGDEAHTIATSKGLRFSDAQSRRKAAELRLRREIEKSYR